MAKKNWVKIKRGFLQPEHRVRIGIRVWLYMFIVDQADWETGCVFDWKDKNAADELGMPIGTLRQQRQELETLGYISCEQRGYRQKITILKWVDPRSYSGEVINNSEGAYEDEDESTDKDSIKGTETSVPLHRTHKSVVSNQLNTVAKKPTEKKGNDPVHPAILIYREVTGRYPNKAIYQQVIDVLGELPDVKFMTDCWVEWCKISQNPSPYKWLFEWYKNREIRVNGGYQKASTLDQSLEAIRVFDEMEAQDAVV